MDAVTGSCSGVDMIVVCVYQCHIRPLVGIDRVLSVCLDSMISPGVCSALLPDTQSFIITYGLTSV